MRFVIQRVKSASVKVSGEIVGEINKGMLVLFGLTHTDKESDLDFAANKLLNLRLWDDEKGLRWKECIKSLNLDILVVSQFTLYSVLKGNKPDFHNALEPETALKLYEIFIEKLKKNFSGNIQCGKFGAMMEVSLVNDGPVTINWEYPSDNQEKIVENISKSNNKNIPKDKFENNKTTKINHQESDKIYIKEVDSDKSSKSDFININSDKNI
jgi:D-tyrosyl-tRNA(Tyr) deacylase